MGFIIAGCYADLASSAHVAAFMVVYGILMFQVFTTLLRPELLASAEALQLALDLLSERKIFSNNLLEILTTAETQGGRLRERQAQLSIPEALATFDW